VARIAGVDLPNEKRIGIGLTHIFGIGHNRSAAILEKAGIDAMLKVKDLTEEQVSVITKTIDKEGGVEGDLRKQVSMNIKRLMDIGAYRGLRHRRSLPARGQRTHTNARTRKGPKRGQQRKR
jgi:small subunit ribosomal protein S13